MEAFSYSNSPYPIRPDLISAYQDAWEKLAHAGTWWSGFDRVAIAEEVRNARDCDFCARRKQALSPFAALEGVHHSTTHLAPEVVDVIHRLTTDPSRLTGTWVEELTSGAISKGQYVEIISVVVTTLCIDSFNQALGFELEPLPEPQPGEPSEYQPDGLETETSWVPMIGTLAENEADLWPVDRSANVIRAMSLVPDAVRLLKSLSAAQYLEMQDVANPTAHGGRKINRAQIEFIAARVSAINDCFY